MKSARNWLAAATLSVALFGGCQSLRPEPPDATALPRGAPPKTGQERKSLLGSWFSNEEPAPPQTMKEWMKLEPIRP